MIKRATPIPGTEEYISPLTMIARCEACGDDLVRIPIELARDPGLPPPWYHFTTGRGLCNVGVHPSQEPVDQLASNL